MKLFLIRKNLIVYTIIIIIIMASFFISINKVINTYNYLKLNKVIVIDAGHGGIDGGAVGKNGTVESYINLEIVLKLRKLLEETGAIVLLSREEDTGLYSDEGTIRNKKNEDLRNRRKLMNESDADLFVSIHLNSFSQSKYYGAQTFYPKNSMESKDLASYIQDELTRVLDKNNKRVAKPKNDIYIFKKCNIPAVLVECGFLSNYKEEQLLKNDNYQEKVAWSIFIGIMKYFNEENKE